MSLVSFCSGIAASQAGADFGLFILGMVAGIILTIVVIACFIWSVTR